MNRYAISFTIKPGTEPRVADVLRHYRRPQGGPTSGGPPLLRRTSVFMHGQRVVRMIDVAGDLGAVMRHLAAQPQIRAVEEALNPFLTNPRDLDSPEGLQEFLHDALLRPTGPAGAPPHRPGVRYGFLFPVRPGSGQQAASLLAESVGPMTTFRRGDVLVGLLEVDGDPAGVLDQWARAGSRAASAPALATVMETGEDLTSESGFRGFLEEYRMELLTDRQAAVPA